MNYLLISEIPFSQILFSARLHNSGSVHDHLFFTQLLRHWETDVSHWPFLCNDSILNFICHCRYYSQPSYTTQTPYTTTTYAAPIYYTEAPKWVNNLFDQLCVVLFLIASIYCYPFAGTIRSLQLPFITRSLRTRHRTRFQLITRPPLTSNNNIFSVVYFCFCLLIDFWMVIQKVRGSQLLFRPSLHWGTKVSSNLTFPRCNFNIFTEIALTVIVLHV